MSVAQDQNDERNETIEAAENASLRFDFIVRPGEVDPDGLIDLLDSIGSQHYSNWRVMLPHLPAALRDTAQSQIRDDRLSVFSEASSDPNTWIRSEIAQLDGDYVGFLDGNIRLDDWALSYCAAYLSANPPIDVLFTDSDRIDSNGQRCRPHFKPSWDPDLFLATEYIFPFCLLRRSLLARILDRSEVALTEDWRFEITWICSRTVAADRIGHLPLTLCHERDLDERPAATGNADQRNVLLEKFPLCEGLQFAVHAHPERRTLRVKPPLDSRRPMVSLLIPTRDRLDLLEPCVTSILEKTSYPHYEVVIIDNDSKKDETLEYLESIRRHDKVKVLAHPGGFNFGAIVNRAARQSTAETIGIINNDTEVIDGEWLWEMACHLLRPDVGIVGAKLYFSDGTVQHGGVILGIGGIAGHAHRFMDGDSHGYESRLDVTHNFSAVTAACSLVRRDVFEELDGFNEIDLPTDYGDVDFCLRARALGYRILWTPHATLFHHESKSRGKPESPQKLFSYMKARRYMEKRWGDLLRADPHYNPNLTLERENFSLAWPPRLSTWSLASPADQ